MLPRHLYVHVPFCARRCAYCDFSIAVRRDVPVGAYADGLAAELRLRFAGDDTWELDTLYLGGGTPSRLGGAGVERILAAIRQHATLAPDAEVTLEANPEDVTEGAVVRWRAAGVNRISLGTQSFDDRALTWMHRIHDAARAEAALDAIRGGGIDNVSLDLIFALPEGVSRSWDADLERVAALGPSHVSLYGLTVEHRTPLARWVERGDIAESPEERYETEFLRAHDAMTAAGYEHYEVSNFARPGWRSRHNWAYWAGAPYAGIGPAAHGFDGTARRWNVGPYERWRALLTEGKDPVGGSETLTHENRVTEAVYLGLRTAAGLRLSGEELASAAPWVQAGWGTLEDADRLVLRAPGWLRLDALTRSLTVVRSRY